MEECELASLAKCICDEHGVFSSVVAADELHTVTCSEYPRAIIINTSKRSSASTIGHWLCLWIFKTRRNIVKCDYFDSVGLPLQTYGIEPPFPLEFQSKVCLQKEDSTSCALFVLLWLFYRLRKFSPPRIQESIFEPSNLYYNECIVRTFSYQVLEKFCKLPVEAKIPRMISSTAFEIQKHFCNVGQGEKDS